MPSNPQVLSIFFLISLQLLQVPPSINAVGFELFHPRPLNAHVPGDRETRSGVGNWCYDQAACDQKSLTSDWHNEPCLSGQRQSPIDIPPRVTISNGYIDFSKAGSNAYNFYEFKLINLEKTVQIGASGKWPESSFQWPEKNGGIYTLIQFHFHWGPNDESGTEHKMWGYSYPLELHLVHYRSGGPDSYQSVEDAVKSDHGDALAVIGVLFEVDPRLESSILDPLTKSAGAFDELTMTAAGEHEKLIEDEPLFFRQELKKHTQAYHYEGSLTTPGCNEIVQWIILKERVKITHANVEKFREFTGQDHTFRKTQDLNGREVSLINILH